MPNPTTLEDVAGVPGGPILKQFLATVLADDGTIATQTVATLAYGTVIAPSLASEFQRITVADGVAFTISNPAAALAGRRLTFDILNSSGGAMGAITWSANFKLAGAFTNPASTKRRTITFYTPDGTNWIEVNRAAADI